MFNPSLCSFINAVLLSSPYSSHTKTKETASGFDKPRIPYSVSRSMRRSLYSSLSLLDSTRSYSLDMGSISNELSAIIESETNKRNKG